MSQAIRRLRAVGALPRLEPTVALVLRAVQVRESVRFVGRELSRRPVTGRYRLRRSPYRVLIRHGTGDVVTLGEVFHRPDYAPPPEVDAILGCPESPLTALDLGANIGLYTLDLLTRRPAARVDAFEPDPANAELLRRVVALNRLDEQVNVHEAAAGASDGEVRFASGHVALSRIEPQGDVTVPLVDVGPRLDGLDLLKMDIEGGEWPILADDRFGSAGPRVVVLEYHPHSGPDAPRDAVESRLRELGYVVRVVSTSLPGHGLVWAWRGA